MDSLDTTYLLAGMHIALAVIVVIMTVRPWMTTFHLVQLGSVLAFGFRPMLAASVGGYVNYNTGTPWSAYNYGLLYQLIFNLAMAATYVMLFRGTPARMQRIEKTPSQRVFFAVFFTGAAAICVLTAFAGAAWLPSIRAGTINTAMPGAKYIFPVAIISFSVLIPLGYIMYSQKSAMRPWLPISVMLVAATALSLLNVRGMVISGMLLIFWVIEKRGTLRVWHLGLALVLMFTIGSLLRPVGVIISWMIAPPESTLTQLITQDVIERTSTLDKLRLVFLYTGNNDVADSWPVVIDYVARNDFLYGTSFLAIPARFASTEYRIRSGQRTASDLLNSDFYGESYVELSFGFNVSLANEFYLNFGPIGLLLGIVPGLLMFRADIWMRRLRSLTSFALFIVYMFYAYGFTGELAATIQWCVGLIIVAIMIEVLSKLRWSRYALEGRPSRSPGILE